MARTKQTSRKPTSVRGIKPKNIGKWATAKLVVQHHMPTLTNHPTTNRSYYGCMYCTYCRFNAIYVNAVDTVVTTIIRQKMVPWDPGSQRKLELPKKNKIVHSQNKICGVRIELIMYVNTVDTTLCKM